jgi:hypothetical protein
MHSLEEELRELGSCGALDEAAVARAVALERRTLFSVFDELRAALYAAVALVIAGVGILVEEHLDRIGPSTLIFALAIAGAACYFPAIRARSRAGGQSTVTDYLLLLGALIVSADVGYAESQFHWFGANWSRHLLLLTVLHAYAAYALRSRLVLSVALTSLVGWFGIERGAGNLAPWHVATPELGLRALACSAVMLVWRAIDARVNAARFREVFEHFATNLAFWAAVGWCASGQMRGVGVVTLVVLAVVVILKALRSGAESFAVYGVGYTALGLSLVVAQVTDLTLVGAALVLAIVLTAAATLRRLHDVLKEART